jgi:hypothetical protein
MPAPTPTPPVSPLLDTDGDGFSDAEELLTGTDPRDAQSRLRLAALARTTTGDVTLSIATVRGRRYCLEACTDLALGDWLIISDNIEGTGAEITVLDPAALRTAPRGFYRLRVKYP